MPLYEYQCTKCNNRFERIQKFSDPLVTDCPLCAGKVERTISVPAIHFKGSGWYVTDYGNKSSTGKKGSGKSDEKTGGDVKAEGKSEAKSGDKSESKSEKTTESKTTSDTKSTDK